MDELQKEHQLEIYKKREYPVVKSNTLIQKSRIKYTAPQQRAIAFICMHIVPPMQGQDKLDELTVEFSLQEFAEVCGLAQNGKNYADIRANLDALRDKMAWVRIGNRITQLAVLMKASLDDAEHIKVIIDPDMKECLYDLKESYTSVCGGNVLAMRGKYSYRLFELLKSYLYKGEWTVTISDFRDLLDVSDIKTYSTFPGLRQKLIEPSLKEINEYTDIQVSYKTVAGKNRKIEKIYFDIRLKDVTERVRAFVKDNEVLNENYPKLQDDGVKTPEMPSPEDVLRALGG